MKKKKRKSKKADIDFSKLTKDQMEFIQAKVVELGSWKRVVGFYASDCTVGAFGRMYGEVYYK